MLRYLAVTPDQLAAARSHTAYLCHVAYRIGDDNRLLCSRLPPTLRGGLLVLSDRDAAPVTRPDSLCRQLLQECLRRDYSGIVLDFEAPLTDDRSAFVRQLDGAVPSCHRHLFVPEALAACTRCAALLICTALSGGSLQQRLTQAAAQYSPPRLALDCQRLAMDFTLPCPDGSGTPLSIPELRRRMNGRAVFFSEALCARYFTYRIGSETHFVLFDDAGTLRRKAELAATLGIENAFFMLPEVSDLLDELFPSPEA